MIVTFNYSEEGVTDPRPVLLFLYRDKKKKTLEGLNLNYINPSKIKKLFSVIEFKKGFLEAIPVDDDCVDLVTSNCVINLSTKKNKVFKEIYRILKPGGRFMIADIISEKEVPEKMKNNKEHNQNYRRWGRSGRFSCSKSARLCCSNLSYKSGKFF